jgi:hypothetical protein
VGGSIASITKEQDVFVVRFSAQCTWLGISEIIFDIVDQHGRIHLSDLHPVLNGIG